nr:helix-turn-helix domain-containing protein [Streptomyces sp. MMBL 11-1]
MSAPPPAPPPEAEVIRVARLARGLSPEAAAERTPVRLGGGRWRHIEQGYTRRVPFTPTTAPAKTLAHMANVVGVDPEQLEGAGREDAAEILREIRRQEAADERSTVAPSDPRVQMAVDILMDLPPRVREEALRRLGPEHRKRIEGS